MQPIRILHVFPSFAPGGVEGRIVDLANRLGDGFHHLVGALDGRVSAAARFDEATCHTLIDVSGLDGLRSWPAIARQLRTLAPDLLCTHNWGAIDWAIVTRLTPGRPHIHFESGFGKQEADRPFWRRSKMRRLALTKAACLVVPSFGLAELAVREKWVAPDRLRHIVNGVDARVYSRRPAGAPEADTPPLVVAVGGLRPEKCFHRLIAALPTDGPGSQALLEFCGDGICAADLKAQAAASPASRRIRFAGHVGDIRSHLARASVFAMSSVTEQMPNALLQAMAMELPVIAFDAGDIRRMLPEEQRSFVFAQDDEAGYRAGLARLLADTGLRHRLGTGNRTHVTRHYSMDAMVEAYRRLFQDTLRAARR